MRPNSISIILNFKSNVEIVLVFSWFPLGLGLAMMESVSVTQAFNRPPLCSGLWFFMGRFLPRPPKVGLGSVQSRSALLSLSIFELSQ